MRGQRGRGGLTRAKPIKEREIRCNHTALWGIGKRAQEGLAKPRPTPAKAQNQNPSGDWKGSLQSAPLERTKFDGVTKQVPKTLPHSQVHELAQGHSVRFWPCLQHVGPDQLGYLRGVQLDKNSERNKSSRTDKWRRKFTPRVDVSMSPPNAPWTGLQSEDGPSS